MMMTVEFKNYPFPAMPPPRGKHPRWEYLLKKGSICRPPVVMPPRSTSPCPDNPAPPRQHRYAPSMQYRPR